MGGDGTGPGTKDEDRNLTSAAQGVVLRHEFAYPSPRWICPRSTCLRGVAVGPAERRWSAEDAMVRSRSTAGKPVNRLPIDAESEGWPRTCPVSTAPDGI